MSLVRRSFVVPCLLSLGVFAIGCDKLTQALEEKAQEVAQEAATPGGAAGPGGTELTEDEKIGQKLDLYIQCTNRASRRIYDSWHRYEERAKEDGTPRKKNLIPFLYKIDSEMTPCEEAVAKGPATEPSMPEVEAAMADYLTHGKAFASHTVALDKYYEQENYKDDDWAKAKEIAPKFKAAFEAWAAADTKLGDIVGAKKDVVEHKMLATVEQRSGKKIEWQSRNTVLAAKGFVRCITAEGAKAEGCEAAFTELETAEQGFRAFYDANKDESDKVFWMSSFQSSADDYYAESKKFMREFRKGDPKPELTNKVVDEYNGLINDSNKLRYTR